MTGRRRDIDDLRGEIQELFAELWHVPRFSGVRLVFRPQCDCYRTDDPPMLHLVVELPGVDPASVEVVAADHSIEISGTRARPSAPGAHYLAMEIEYGAFQRRLDLGDPIDADKAVASYERGMLRVTLPIASDPPRAERIPIEVTRS